jgi:hypothetical protein
MSSARLTLENVGIVHMRLFERLRSKEAQIYIYCDPHPSALRPSIDRPQLLQQRARLNEGMINTT